MQLRSVFGLTLLAVMASCAPALAFEELLKAVSRLPVEMKDPIAFDYAAPQDGFAGATPIGGQDDAQLTTALLRGAYDAVTGIDFGKVEASLVLGMAPKTITVLFGQPGFAQNAPDALRARDFTATERGSLRLFASGDDYALDLAAAAKPDPLGRGLGQSQRIAIADDYIIRTAGWPEMDSAIGAMTGAADRSIWADAIEAIRQAAGKDAHLDYASGWTFSAFSAHDPVAEAGATHSGAMQPNAPAMDPIAAFPLAVIGQTGTGAATALHIALPYGDDATAQQAGQAIAARLAALSPQFEPAQVVTTATHTAGAKSIVVVTITVPDAEAKDAQAVYAGWIKAIYQRDFSPLMSDG